MIADRTKMTRNIPDEIPEEFWKIIESLRTSKNSFSQVFDSLDETEIIRFAWNYEESALQMKMYFESTYEFSEDSVDEFCFWIVSQGEEYYRQLWEKCEFQIVTNMNSELQYQADPGFYSAACDAFYQRTGEEVPEKNDDLFY
ncbi:hypothetical protein MNBD_GAMMA09-1691 [hydrothermal vent metagenome]|uniref:DUF4240 domain-containing protein n=1 Tax=hydrothermal vent metagenome TaxID=652676 RepID=A0A3B0XYR9_9ZZZZ